MPEFFTVYKNGESKQTNKDLLELDQAEGWSLDPADKSVVKTAEHGEQLLPVNEALGAVEAGGEFTGQNEILDRQLAAESEERTSGVLEGVQAFGEAGLSTLLPGVGGEIARGISEASGEESGAVAERYENRPGAAFAGSLTATLASVMAPTGLAGAAGKAAKLSPLGAATTLAGRAGKAVKGATGSRTAALVAEGAIDGALIGAGQRIAEASISDEPITVEQILAGMPSDVLFGAATGGVLGGLGKLSKQITKGKATSKLEKAASATDKLEVKASIERIADNVDHTITKAVGSKGITPISRALNQPAGKFNKHIDGLARLEAQPVIDPSDVQKLAKSYPSIRKPLIDAEGIPTPLGETVTKAGIDLKVATASEANEVLSKLYVARQLEKVSGGKAAPGQISAGLAAPLGKNPVTKVLNQMTGSIKKAQNSIKRGVADFIEAAGKPRAGAVRSVVGTLEQIKYAMPTDSSSEKSPKAKSKLRKAFNARAAEIKHLASNPNTVKQGIEKSTGIMGQLKPALQDSISSAAYERFKFLSKMLPSGSPSNGFSSDKYYPTETEMAKFAKIAAAVEDPIGTVFEGLNSGRLSQETVDTVRMQNPEVYAAIQESILENLEQIKAKSSYQDRIQLGVLFQIPTDVTLEPSFIQLTQGNYAARDAEREEAGGGQFSTPGAAQKSINSAQTASQRMEQK